MMEEFFYNIDPDRIQESPVAPSPPEPAPRVSTPEPRVNLRPRGRGRKFGSSGNVGRPDSPLTQADVSVNNASANNSSFASNPDDSIYVTPDESMNKGRERVKEKPFPGKGDLTPLFKEECKESVASSDAPCQSVKPAGMISTVLQTTAAKKEAPSAAQGREIKETRTIVDWFEYDASESNGVSTEDNKLNTRKKVNSVSVNLITNEMDSDLKEKKKRKEINKVKSEESVKNGREMSGVSAGSGNSGNKQVKPNVICNEPVTDKPQEAVQPLEAENVSDKLLVEAEIQNNQEDWDTGNSIPAAEEVVESVPSDLSHRTGKTFAGPDSTDKRVTAVNKVEAVTHRTDWWGDEDTSVSGVIPGVSGSCDIYNDFGPDVIIEGEFEGSVSECKADCLSEHTDPSDRDTDSRASSVVSESVGRRSARGRGRGSRRGSEPDVAPVSMVVPAGLEDDKDVIEFEVNTGAHVNTAPDWDPDLDDDFDSNGKVDETYEMDFPTSDLRSVVRPLTTVGTSPSPVSSGNQGRDQFPSTVQGQAGGHSLGEFLPEELAAPAPVDVAPARPRWTPGPRRCLACHQLDHTTDVCPNKKIILL